MPEKTTSANFVAGEYSVLGVPVADPDDMFESDDVDGDPWDKTKIEAGVGYWNGSGEAAGSYHGAALAAVGTEFVMVAEVVSIDPLVANFNIIAYEGTFDAETTFIYGHLSGEYVQIEDGVTPNVRDDEAELGNGLHRVAFRVSASKASACVDGRELVSITPPFINNLPSVVTFYSGGTSHRKLVIRSVDTYPNSITDEQMQALTAITPPDVLINFQHEEYQSDGVDVALATLTTEDGDNWYPFDPADIIHDTGYSVSGSKGPVFIGAALSSLTAGSSVLIDFNFVAPEDPEDTSSHSLTLDLWKGGTFDPSYRAQIVSQEGGNATKATDFTNDAAWTSPAIGYGYHIASFTLADGQLKISIDGGVDVAASGVAWAAAPDFAGLNTGGSPTTVIRSVKIFTPPVSPLPLG